MPIVWRVAHHHLIANVHYVSKVHWSLHRRSKFSMVTSLPDLRQDELGASAETSSWTLMTPTLTTTCSQRVLEQQPKPLFDTPDGALGEWLAATGDMSDSHRRQGLG